MFLFENYIKGTLFEQCLGRRAVGLGRRAVELNRTFGLGNLSPCDNDDDDDIFLFLYLTDNKQFKGPIRNNLRGIYKSPIRT